MRLLVPWSMSTEEALRGFSAEERETLTRYLATLEHTDSQLEAAATAIGSNDAEDLGRFEELLSRLEHRIRELLR